MQTWEIADFLIVGILGQQNVSQLFGVLRCKTLEMASHIFFMCF